MGYRQNNIPPPPAAKQICSLNNLLEFFLYFYNKIFFRCLMANQTPPQVKSIYPENCIDVY